MAEKSRTCDENTPANGSESDLNKSNSNKELTIDHSSDDINSVTNNIPSEAQIIASTLETLTLDAKENSSPILDSSNNLECSPPKKIIEIKIPTEPDKMGIRYKVFSKESEIYDVMKLISNDLSEPYSIYTYRYFIYKWPSLCILAYAGDLCVGTIVCKQEIHKRIVTRGYIAMLAVHKEYRRQKIASKLVMYAVRSMAANNCDEVVLETEVTNVAALELYAKLGFMRYKRLYRYYLNGADALRLKLWLT